MKPRMTPADVKTALRMVRSGNFSQNYVAKIFGVSRQYISKLCKDAGMNTAAITEKREKRRASQAKKQVKLFLSNSGS